MSTRQIKGVTVIGGGTAGWLTALYVKTVLPTKTVTLIESPDIKILGAGEGSTPPLISFLDILEIPVSRFIRECGTTIKNGIKFTNWHNGGNSDFYFNTFSAYGNLSLLAIDVEKWVSGGPAIWALAQEAKDAQTEYDINARLSEKNKVAFRQKKDQVYSVENPIFQFEQMSAFSIHFDAEKIIKVLKEIAQERGIIYIEGEVVDFTTDEIGDVKQLQLAHGAGIDTDFVFDCTGFKSFFSEKLNSTWVSHKEHLTVNSGMPFFLEMDEEIPPYTEAIAMKYGWIWKIPLQHRYGCGYVFDSNYINDEEAKAEIVEWLGYEPEWPRQESLKFEAGYLSNPWQNNVIRTGLAGGFIEPLEATSIWSSITSIARVLGNVENLYKVDQRIVNDYNSHFSKIHEEIAAFVYLHYMTGRNDTDFWKHYTKENAPNNLTKILDIAESRVIYFQDVDVEDQFPMESWYSIFVGIKHKGLLENMKLFEFYNFTRSFLKNKYHFHKKTVETVEEFEAITHNEFLAKLKEDIE